MYKIYINETPILLISNKQAEAFDKKDLDNLLMPYNYNKNYLYRYIDNLEKGADYESIVLHAADLKQLRKDFFSLFKVRKAGGGVVFNPQNEILAIFRRGHWDLPKGKAEKGETIKQTALREVQEETGLNKIKVGEFIADTYHVFRNRKDERILKWSVWYKMFTKETDLIPQTEEDIEEAVFLSKSVLMQKRPIYKNILEVLKYLDD